MAVRGLEQTLASALGLIDAQAAYLQHLQPQLQQALGCDAPTAHQRLNQIGAQTRFVPDACLPAGMAYEVFIYTEQRIPTRDNLHDFFGGLMWLHLPRTKARMNQVQFQEIERDGPQAKRSALRNAVTLLDESGLLLHAPEPIWQALCARQWQRALYDLRPLWQQCQIFIIGHGLLEQLCQHPHLGLTAPVLRVDLEGAAGDWDRAAAQALEQQVLPAVQRGDKPFTPLPIFGIPHWHADNAQADFYAYTQVFRPLPQSR